MLYILKEVLRHPYYNYFVRFGNIYNPDLPCKRHHPDTCRCRWAGDAVVRGTKAEATRYETKAKATKVLLSKLDVGCSRKIQCLVNFEVVAVPA
jgi:hypothetical protein